MKRGLCESAKQGNICGDDLCHGSPDDTLCGFNESEYNLLTDILEEIDIAYDPIDDDEEL